MDAQAGQNPDRGDEQSHVQRRNLAGSHRRQRRRRLATEPAPPSTIAATLILGSQERSFDFLPTFVCGCLFPLRQI
ncbi:hypothetical protein [Mesorhizobium sp. B2-7-2]|uniref:hypothetical protein n=1 Tax=Mesorhizobium sp. B2-7-2 TaxID=2589908 RepID=UPI0015E319AF|nr:hypothetical protein [Mesorhizobium sp. B2-7-2]